MRKVLTKEKVIPGYIRKPDGNWVHDSEKVIHMDTYFPESVAVESQLGNVNYL